MLKCPHYIFSIFERRSRMRYFREHSRLISRLFINQVGMTIFGVILTLAVMRSTDNNLTLTVAVSIFSILFYLCLIYNVMWEEGARNVIRVNAGRMEKIPCFSLKAALFASVPNFVLAALLVLGYVLAYPLALDFGKSLYATMHIILGLFEAMYVGLFGAVLGAFPDTATQSLVACGLYTLSSLPMILVSMLAYRFGEKSIYIFGKRKPKKRSED